MERVISTQLAQVIAQYGEPDRLIGQEAFGSGHINDTILLTFKDAGKGQRSLVLQRINTEVFTDPDALMENILSVTAYLRTEIERAGGDPNRETLKVIPTLLGAPYYKDSLGHCWRAVELISDTISYDQVEKAEDFYESGLAFGRFQRLLADYPADTLHETIKGFHDTKARFQVFLRAVKEDLAGRAAKVQKEIQFVLDHEALTLAFDGIAARGEVPLRVTHNDTKLNNVLMDACTGKGLCVVDLDTVMPGLAMNDFGDAIRFGASTAAEDEPDISKVECSMELFKAFTQGFLEGCEGRLTQREIELLPMGAMVMTFECGMRFLTDYLEGDVYYKIHRPEHNLDRCRTQFKLVEDMEKKWDQMMEIVTQA